MASRPSDTPPDAGATSATTGAAGATGATGSTPPPAGRPTETSLKAWVTRCTKAQSARDPAKVERTKRQAALRSRAQTYYKTASKMQCTNAISSHAYFGAMKKAAKRKGRSAPAATFGGFGAGSGGGGGGGGPESDDDDTYADIATTAAVQMAVLSKAVRKASSADAAEDDEDMALDVADELDMYQAPMPVAELAAAPESLLEGSAMAYEMPMAPASAPMGGGGGGGGGGLFGGPEEQSALYSAMGAGSRAVRMAAVVTTVEEGEATSLLGQLRAEPEDDEEKAALFKLYEANQETVQVARQGLFEFWGECGPDFSDHAMVKASIEADLKKIDSAENMGIHFVDGVWFVHGMAVQVTRNNGTIDGVLRMIRTKLDLLGSQDECPICIEPLADLPKVALGCAHMVCADCWRHWSKAQADQGLPAFCPLCKNDDFLENIQIYGSRINP